MQNCIELNVRRSERFYELAQQLSDFIAGLPLDKQQNDQLVFMLAAIIDETELNATIQSSKMLSRFFLSQRRNPSRNQKGGRHVAQ